MAQLPGNQQTPTPAEASTSVLLVGEGNFSFALALSSLLWPHSKPVGSLPSSVPGSDDVNAANCAANVKKDPTATSECPALSFLNLSELPRNLTITATSFDSEREVLDKYPETRGILQRLSKYSAVKVLHNINAWQLAHDLPNMVFDRIIWNHPHLGLEDFRLHRFLLAHFMTSARNSLAKDGEVFVTLVQGQEERWNIIGQAARGRLELAGLSCFNGCNFPGYQAKRNKTGQSFKNISTQRHHHSAMPSAVFRFKAAADESAVQEALQDLYIPANSWVRKPQPAPSTYQCQHCSKMFASNRAVATHTRQVHDLMKYGKEWAPERKPCVECTICHAMFVDQTAQWQHTVAIHGDCNLIEEQYSSQPDNKPLAAQGDDVTQLGDSEQIICDVCSMSLPIGWDIALHLESLKPVIGIQAKCPLCSAKFIEIRALKQHYNFCRLTSAKSVPQEATAEV